MKNPKYYSLWMDGDGEFEVSAHMTRSMAEQHLLNRAKEDEIEADSYSDLEEKIRDMFFGGDETARCEVGVFANWEKEIE